MYVGMGRIVWTGLTDPTGYAVCNDAACDGLLQWDDGETFSYGPTWATLRSIQSQTLVCMDYQNAADDVLGSSLDYDTCTTVKDSMCQLDCTPRKCWDSL
jgi:hypothetical protein